MIQTVAELISEVGGARSLATALGFNEKSGEITVAVWKTRGYVPPRYADFLRKTLELPVSGEVFRMYEGGE